MSEPSVIVPYQGLLRNRWFIREYPFKSEESYLRFLRHVRATESFENQFPRDILLRNRWFIREYPFKSEESYLRFLRLNSDRQDGGPYSIVGRVTKQGIPGSYTVRLFFKEDFRCIQKTLSKEDGTFEFRFLRYTSAGYFVVASDHSETNLGYATLDNIPIFHKTQQIPSEITAEQTVNLGGCSKNAYIDPSEAPGKIEGTVKLRNTVAQADLYLVDLNECQTVKSSEETGRYGFYDSGDHSIIPESDKLVVICSYGPDIRPLAHGFVRPQFYVIPQPEEWTPAEISSSLWLDAADESSITFESGKISVINDKSGNLRHFSQTDPAKRPQIITFNDNGAIDIINGTSLQGNTAAKSVARNRDSVQIFAIVNAIGGDVRRTIFNSSASADTRTRSALFIKSDETVEAGGRRLDSDGYQSVNKTKNYLVEGSFDYLNAQLRAGTFGSSIPKSSAFQTAGRTPDTDSFATYIGGIQAGGEQFIGQICEVLVFSEMLSPEDYMRVIGYLAHKWNLEENLPLNNPYRLAAPKRIYSDYDSLWEHVSLLLPLSAEHGFLDLSNSNLTTVVAGDVNINNDVGKTYSSSAYFDGISDSITVPPRALPGPLESFTIEFWCRPSLIIGSIVFDARQTAGLGFVMIQTTADPSVLGVYAGDTNNAAYEAIILSPTGTLVLDTWTHVAVTRNGQWFGLFINGVLYSGTASWSGSIDWNTSVGGMIGKSIETTSNFKGYIQDFRITRKYPRYVRDFALPKKPIVKNESGYSADPHWNNVVLLLPLRDGDFKDHSNLSNTVTVFGNTRGSRDQWKYGGSSAYFDGGGDYLQVGGLVDFSGDFTLECWVFPQGMGSILINSQYSSNHINLYLGSKTAGTFIINNTNAISNIVFTGDAWQHVAISRSGTLISLFIDGKFRGSVLNSTSFHLSSTFYIGAFPSGHYFTGNMSDVRYTNGIARYTEDFIPPPRQLPLPEESSPEWTWPAIPSGTAFMNKLRKSIARFPGVATATRSAMGATLAGTQKWAGGVLGPDGKIYCVPHNSTDILIIDPAEGTATRSAMGATLTGTLKWIGGVLGPDGKIYCAPFNSTDILIIDTVSGTATRSAMGATLTGTLKWVGGVLGPDGKIYCVPHNSTDILIIDPAEGTATRSAMGATLTGTLKWAGGVLGPDGKIYCSPLNSADILIIDTVSGTATRSAMGASLSGSYKWFGAAIGSDGKIYCVPHDSTDILIIDPVTATATRSAMGASLSGTGKWCNVVSGPDGKIYGSPLNSADILIIDPVTGTAARSAMGASLSGSSKFYSVTLAANGKIYCVPHDSTDILIIDTAAGSAFDMNLALDPRLNNF